MPRRTAAHELGATSAASAGWARAYMLCESRALKARNRGKRPSVWESFGRAELGSQPAEELTALSAARMTPSMNGRDARADASRSALVRDLERVASGDKNAMARVYASTSPKLNALLIRMLHDPSEAEEVLQDVYFTVWRRSAAFDPSRASPITWLVTIARNRAIDRIRANRAARKVSISSALDGLEVSHSIGEPSDRIEEADESRRLLVCLEALESPARKAIRAAFFEDQTYEQLAAREGVPLGTMKSWIRRGLISLRKCMTDKPNG